jgi:DNA polymerase I
METTFQVLDSDYIMVNNKPVLRLFGKEKTGRTICAFLEGDLPYFYVLADDEEKVISFVEKNFSSLVVKIESVKKFLPIGFQK